MDELSGKAKNHNSDYYSDVAIRERCLQMIYAEKAHGVFAGQSNSATLAAEAEILFTYIKTGKQA